MLNGNGCELAVDLVFDELRIARTSEVEVSEEPGSITVEFDPKSLGARGRRGSDLL
jgi:hypothetical protein